MGKRLAVQEWGPESSAHSQKASVTEHQRRGVEPTRIAKSVSSGLSEKTVSKNKVESGEALWSS